MLECLSVNNLAILENVNVSFKEGFTAVTGGTGAGKSLIIDSLSLLLGERASSDLIRQGEEKAVIKGTFLVDSTRLLSYLQKREIPVFDGKLTIERTISKAKSQCKANGVNLTVGDLNELARGLANIHNQLDFAKILNPENYLAIIDGFSFDLTSRAKEDYGEALASFRQAQKEEEKLLERKKRFDENRDFLLYQKKELDTYDLKEGEEEEIEREIALLKNRDLIYNLSMQAKDLIDQGGHEKIFDLAKVIERLLPYQPQFQAEHDRILDHYYELEDALSNLKKEFASLDYEPGSLDRLEERQVALSALKRKYGKTIPELIAYSQELNDMVGNQESFAEQIEEAKKSTEECRQKALKKAAELTQIRKRVSSSIEKELGKHLSDLLLQSHFQIVFTQAPDFKEDGLDEVDFLIETNIGEGLKSLGKIASGGEASRIMLAFKAVLLKANKVGTAVFDEIDSGLSGEEAMAVANKIRELSRATQVIAITHLPQMAARADEQILITKYENKGRVSTKIEELGLEERIEEIAHLISGGKVTEKQIEYAKEMLFSFGEK